MRFVPTPIADVVLIEPDVFGDERGFFMETWQAVKFKQAGLHLYKKFADEEMTRSPCANPGGTHSIR